MSVRRQDWTLLAVAAADGDWLTPVQLQKVLFLLGDRQAAIVGSDFYRFRPYNYGPFSADVYKDAEALAAVGLLEIEVEAPRRAWALYRATPEGLRQARNVAAAVSPASVEYLRRLVEWARSLSFHQLVSAVYSAYPHQRARSIFVD